MRIFISYFNKIKKMDERCLPLSTAMWDPKWYHDSKGKDYVYYDKRGILVGCRCEPLVLPFNEWQELQSKHVECTKDCKQKPFECEFMKKYLEHLRKIDFNDFINCCEKLCETVRKTFNTNIDYDVILMVHERPAIKCAERPMLKQWFKENGRELEEWENDIA